MNLALDCGIALAAFFGGRAFQWVRDARHSMGSSTKHQGRR